MKYIGDREIDKIDVTTVYFKPEEGKPDSEVFSEKLLTRIVSEEPVDASALRDIRCFDVSAEILKVLLENNVYLNEVEYILQRVIWSFGENRNTAEDKLWGAEDDKKTVLQLDRIMKS